MSDRSYYWTRFFSYPFFWVCSRPLILHGDRADIGGGYLLAPNHPSHFDGPLLVGYAPRNVDFLVISDMRRKRIARAYFGLYNVFYFDTHRPDTGAVREAIRRLRNGRVVGWFPEGGVRQGADSVLNGGPILPAIASVAAIADVPVIPCVMIGGEQYERVRSWLPLRRTCHGINFGNPIRIDPSLRPLEAKNRLLQDVRKSYLELNAELIDAMRRSGRQNALQFANC